MESAFGGANRAGRETKQDVLPASQYLQERLQERRASTRHKKARQSDFGPRRGRDDDIFLNEVEQSQNGGSRGFDSSPMVAGSRNGSEAGGSSLRKRAMGVKDLDGHMDRLTKQNFALKLELDHRREHTAKLQEHIEAARAKVERAEQLQEEHTELLRINSQLVAELENRDKAVEEAMDLICDLEDQVAELKERNSATRPSTANADSGYAGTETHEQAPPSSPPEVGRPPKTPHVSQRQPPPAASAATSKLFNAVNGQSPVRARREPAVLSQKKPSTQALRSVYLEASKSLNPVQSFQSLLSRREEEDEERLSSPRLSVLSKSSFPSLYSPKKASPEKYPWEGEDDELLASPAGLNLHLRQDSIKRVSQWMDDRDAPEETPSKSNAIAPSLPVQTEAALPSSPPKRSSDDARYHTGTDAMSATAVASQPSIDMMQSVAYAKPHAIRIEQSVPKKQPKPTSFGGPIFGEPLLPPTPDSASTRMLRDSRSSLGDKSLLDTTPVAMKSYDALEPGVRTAPKQMRSSVELNSAYQSYIQRRSDQAIGGADAVSDEEDDDDILGYGGFPDGSSILAGTPSRFLNHSRPSGPNSRHDDYFTSQHAGATNLGPQMKRRQSSAETTVNARKPSFGRAETSPTVFGTLAKISTNGPKDSSGSVTSPRSYHSGSSSNRTVVHNEERDRAFSPDSARGEVNGVGRPPQPRNSESPARTLSQKTQRLFRRMSNSHKDSSHSDREKSPLPTLTSTPSSAYVNNIPRESRRPGTSQSGELTPQAGQRSSTSQGRRPSIQGRTNTAPNVSARPSTANDHTPTEKDSRNPFKRSQSAKKGNELPTQASNNDAVMHSESGRRGSATRRRGSIRDAVGTAARRPWR